MLFVDEVGGDIAVFVPERVQGGRPVVCSTDTGEFGRAIKEAVDTLEEAIEIEKDEVLVDGVVEHEVDPLLDVVLDRGDCAPLGSGWRHGERNGMRGRQEGER